MWNNHQSLSESQFSYKRGVASLEGSVNLGLRYISTMAPKRKAADDDLDFGQNNILATAELTTRPRRSTRAKKSDNIQTQQASLEPPFEKEDEDESTNEEDAKPAAAKSQKGKGKGKIVVSEEKRQARFKKACPKVIEERVDRVRKQRCVINYSFCDY